MAALFNDDKSNVAAESPPSVPPGLPSWITSELIEKTLAVWQPYYVERLSTEDAVDMLLSAGRLLNVVTGREA